MKYTFDNMNLDLFVIERHLFKEGFFPDVVVGIARGGMIPAVCLAHRMSQDNNVQVDSLVWQTRDGSHKDSNHLKDMLNQYKHKYVLFIDDIIDSGETFFQIDKELQTYNAIGAFFPNVKYTSLIYNTSQTKFKPHFYGRKIDRNVDKDWIKFWWEE